MVGECGLGVFSERLTVSCLADSSLGTVANDVQHPNWSSQTVIVPPVNPYESRVAELLRLFHRTNSAILTVAASEGLREIAWESDLRFA
jgi:hypothetical protein